MPPKASRARTLGVGVDQGPVLVLPVELDEPGGGLGQGADRGHPPVDPRPGATAADHRPGQHDLAVLTVGTGPGPTVDEPALDHGLVGAGPHHRRIGPAPEEQAEGLDQQGLAGPGLAGEGGHPRRQRRR